MIMDGSRFSTMEESKKTNTTYSSCQDNRPKLGRVRIGRSSWVLLLSLCWSMGWGPLQVTAEETSTAEEAEESTPIKQFQLELGRIQLKEFRPTRNETIKLRFGLTLSFRPEVTEADYKLLQSWKHRLRDQVLTAVRTAHTKDFHERDLSRLRQIIRFRLEQVLKARVVDSLLLSDYSFSIN